MKTNNQKQTVSLEDNNKRAKFDDAPTAKITGSEIFKWEEPLNMRDIRSKVVPWMKENGYLRSDYENLDTGWDNIIVSPNGVKNSLQHGAGPEKIQVTAALPEMIRDSIHVHKKSGKANQIKMTEHIFAAKVDIGEKSMAVGFIIKEDVSGRRFYDHELTEIMNLDELPSQVGKNRNARNLVRTHRGSIIKIIQESLSKKIIHPNPKVNT